MKRILIVLLIMILTRIISFSENTSILTKQDSIVLITATDLKYANLIFIEHDKLLKDNILLNQQLNNYINLNNQLVEIDSLRLYQIYEYDRINQDYAVQIDNLNKKIKEENQKIKGWQIGSLTVTIGLVVFLLLK